MMNSKKGISIVAVLLFMLIATIAGTATYRWLSSEGRSSASRMFQSEARMAAVAGIESARSWFAHHGNETGAIVKQTKNAKKKNKAVKLDNVLVSFKKDKQNYSVYVVDVDDSKQPYKIKVVSEGTSRDGTAKFSETAIFNVSGLYQVGKPTKTSPVNFDANYFGGSVNMNQGSAMESMMVSGDVTGNEISVSRKLVATGNVGHSSNKITLADTNCIGGNLENDNDGIWGLGSHLYIAGDAKKFSYASGSNFTAGDIYVGGNFELSGSANTNMVIGGNVSVNGNYVGNSTAKNLTINGDFCLGNNSTMDLASPSGSDKGGLEIKGSTWIPKGDALFNSGYYAFDILGGQNKTAYINGITKCVGYYKEFDNGLGLSTQEIDGFTDCRSDMYYQVSGESNNYEAKTSECETSKTEQIQGDCKTYRCEKKGSYRDVVLGGCLPGWNKVCTEFNYTTKTTCVEYKKIGYRIYPNYALFTTRAEPNASMPSAQKPECAQEAKNICTDSYLNTSNMCPDGKTPKIDDLLSTAAKYYGNDDNLSKCVKDKVTNGDENSLMNGAGIDIINDCYATSSSELYNGYLVVKASATKLTKIFGSTNGRKFKGKFIIYVDEHDNSGNKISGKLPPTENMDDGKQSVVFMYLPNGGGAITQSGGGNEYRYFIYSMKNIESIGSESEGKWTGSFYFSADKCAKLEKLGNGQVQSIVYDESLIADLANNAIICGADAFDCGGSAADDAEGSSSGGSGTSDNKDSVYVAVGANLLVELESQYKTTENISSSENVASSVVVLPRIVYLNSDAEGELRDYFSVIPLNGAKISGAGSLSCSNRLLEAIPLPDLEANTNAICTYSNVNNGNNFKSEFYVAIEGAANAIPKVGFDGDAAINLGLETDHSIDVIMNIGAVNNGAGKYELDVVVSGQFDWIDNVVTSDNFEVVDGTSDTERRYHLSGNISPNETTAKLFVVKTTTSSPTGNLVFTIENAKNCRPVAAVKSITLRGSMQVVRAPISEYCAKDENRDGDYCKNRVPADFSSIPSCTTFVKNNFGENFEWITAVGDECSVSSENETPQTNNKWRCYMGSSINLVRQGSSKVEEYCEVYLPGTNNTITTFTNNNDQSLYAEIKHKKATLDIELKNRSSGYALMYLSTKAYSSYFDVLKAIDDRELTNPVTCNDSKCTESVYAGYHVYLVGKSTTTDKFSHWEYPSSVAGEANVKVEGNPYHIFVKGNTTAIGVFNDRDDHCFYENFDGTQIFCNSNTYNCIDTCDGETHCSLNDHKNSNANWTMVRSNTKEDPENCIVYGRSALLGGECKKHWSIWGFELVPDYVGSCCVEPGYFKPLERGNGTVYFRRGDKYVDFDPTNWKTSSGFNGDDHKDGQTSVILNHVDAGANGTLTASFYTENIPYTSGSTDQVLIFNVPQYLNSGFILRSNDDASKYLTLGIYGKSLGGSEAGSVNMYARVCYFDANDPSITDDGRTMKSAENCVAQKLKYTSIGKLDIAIPVSMLNKLNLEAKLQGNSLNVTVGVEQILGSNSINATPVQFDLSAAPFSNLYSESSDNPYRRVGMKLADDNFRIYDIAWRADGSDCWDTPYATCSFAANYAGGRVPENQDAMPWVNTSTWLSDKVAAKECEVTYFYNGCDMDPDRYDQYSSFYEMINSWRETAKKWFTGSFCREPSDNGLYWDDQDGNRDGVPLKEGVQYNFSYRGLHGEMVSPPEYTHTGIIRNASVRVSCDGMKRSYIANCGSFWVGSINECSRNEVVYPYSASGFPYLVGDIETDKSFVMDQALNLRNAALEFRFDEDPGSVDVSLKDETGHASKSKTISLTDNVVSVDDLVDEYGFDPENVKEIIFNSKGAFVVNGINSVCANAATATCLTASYSSEDGWRLSGEAKNGEACEMLVSDGIETKSATVICGNSPFVPVITEEITALNNWANSVSAETEFQVSLRVTKGEDVVTCEPATKVTVSPAPATSSPKPAALLKEATSKSATCSKIDNGIYRIEVSGCDSYDNCSVKTRKNDDMPEVVCNWVTYGCDVSLYNAGTYDIIFNDGVSDRRLAGCSGIVFEEGVGNE